MSGPTKAARLKQAMRATFLAPNGSMSDAQALVLTALAQQCAAGRTPVVISPIDGKVDPNATLIATGRQEVWHWINQLLGIPDIEVARMAARDLRE